MTHHNRPARNWCITVCLRLKDTEELLLADGSKDRVYEPVPSERGQEIIRYACWQPEKGEGGEGLSLSTLY